MSREAKKLIEDFCKVIKRNEKFLRKYAEETYNECIELINDAIDYTKNKENYTNSFYFFSNHILMPLSYAVWMDLLCGNLPACFIELRLILESLAMFFLIGPFSQESEFFKEMLNSALYKEKISKILKDFGNRIGLKDEPITLWGKLSENWVHTKGIVKRVVSEIIEKSDVPSWALVIPIEYTNSELEDIKELRKRISKLRELIKIAIQ